MNDLSARRRSSPSRTDQTYSQLREELVEVIGLTGSDVQQSDRFQAIVPPRDRRQVWRKLRDDGFELPGLVLSSRVLLFVTICVLAPVLVLYVVVKNWTAFFSLGELGFLARRLTRPWAIHPPVGCETVREAVLHLTPFSQEDYEAGLWPREDIADKVRLIVARATGTPFDSVTEETRLDDICC